ncbi:MAG: hypothetical protein RMY63_16045 [Nostoc sp. ChiQUE01b]|nr:hypothetical protein [Nostoc sp. ChiQUE01b]
MRPLDRHSQSVILIRHDPRLDLDPCWFVDAYVRHCHTPVFQLIQLNANSAAIAPDHPLKNACSMV